MTNQVRSKPTVKKNLAIDPGVLEMLVCPLTKTRLCLKKDKSELVSRAARIAFPIKDGVPLICIEESRDITDEEFEALPR